MINYCRYRLKLQKFFNEKKKQQDLYSREIKKAHKQNKSPQEIHMIKHEEFYEVETIQEKIDILITNYLRNKANILFVPLPDYDDKKMWTECSMISQQKVLTTLGISTIKTAIRKEWKERTELYLMWATFIVVSLTGIIGAITGLVAVLKK